MDGTLAAAIQPEADVHSSSEEYALRFAGDVGAWMLSVQENALLRLLDSDCRSILDVAGGHGQVTRPLVESGRSVTVLGSHASCGDRLSPLIDSGLVSFRVGELLHIPFPDQSFDAVVCFRFLSHTPRWREVIRELCRVARRAVIIDYPSWRSVNIVNPLFFQLKKQLEGNTRTFTVFFDGNIYKEFGRAGFAHSGEVRQFFFPMALHRSFRKLGMSKRLEEVAKRFGLTGTLGSPVVLKMVRE